MHLFEKQPQSYYQIQISVPRLIEFSMYWLLNILCFHFLFFEKLCSLILLISGIAFQMGLIIF